MGTRSSERTGRFGSVEVAREVLEGRLPDVCAVTGAPTRDRREWDFSWVPRRRWASNLLWMHPVLVVWQRSVDAERLRVALPMTEVGWSRLLGYRIGLRITLASAFVLVVAGLAARSVGGLVLGLGVLLGWAIAAWFVSRRSPSVVEGSRYGMVRLSGVSRELAEALDPDRG